LPKNIEIASNDDIQVEGQRQDDAVSDFYSATSDVTPAADQKLDELKTI
jgi:hypothetical protein